MPARSPFRHLSLFSLKNYVYILPLARLRRVDEPSPHALSHVDINSHKCAAAVGCLDVVVVVSLHHGVAFQLACVHSAASLYGMSQLCSFAGEASGFSFP